MSNQKNRVISVIIPCRNEKRYIEKNINSLLNQKNLKDDLEVIIVDGMSDDGTREILKEISEKNLRVKVIDNPKIITPVALNLGIKNSKGNYICIMGAHSEYDENYLANCIQLFEKYPEVSCVGGPIISKGKNNFSKAVALAMSSYIGVGNAKHRFPDYEGYAEMACFPMFKRSVFEEIGYYDENLIKNQDDEFCFRLRRKGGKIYISPKVISVYYVRETPYELFKQYFNYGLWRIVVLRKHKIPIALRQFIPALFFLFIVIFFIIAYLMNDFIIGLILPVIYLFIILILSVKILFKCGFKIWANFFLAVLILHFSYAAGFIVGLFKKRKYNSNENSI